MNITVYGVALIGIIMGLVEMVKCVGVSTKYCPIISVMLGIAFGVLFLSDGNVSKGLILGIACGLSASGLYDNVTANKGEQL